MERFARSRTVRCCMLVVAMMIMNPFMVASEGEIGKLTTPCGEIEVPVMTIPNVVCITYCGPDVGAVRCADANKDQEVVDPRFALVSGSDVQILIRGYVDVGSFSRVLSAITGWTVKNTLDESIRVQPVFWRGLGPSSQEALDSKPLSRDLRSN